MVSVNLGLSQVVVESLLRDSSITWHQKFQIAEGVWSPGVNDIDQLLLRSGLPLNLEGLSVLDIGTTNGAVAFEAEKRGSRNVIALDIFDNHVFGFEKLRSHLGSSVKFVQGSVYELENLFSEQFDIVIFFGVLYHLRHPLLALDAIRGITSGYCLMETAVLTDGTDAPYQNLAAFHRHGELNGDSSNWWSPSISTLKAWCLSSGFSFEELWGNGQRHISRITPTQGPPEYSRISYEKRIRIKS